MDVRAWRAERFEEHRMRLRAVAYRMLGSLSEADDPSRKPGWTRHGEPPWRHPRLKHPAFVGRAPGPLLTGSLALVAQGGSDGR